MRGLRSPMPRFAASWRPFTRQHPAPLLEDCIDPAVQCASSLLDVGASDNDLLGRLLHFIHDAFPLGNLWRGPGALQLVEESLGVDVACKFCALPRRAPGWKVPAQRMETNLHSRFRKILDQTPRSLSVR